MIKEEQSKTDIENIVLKNKLEMLEELSGFRFEWWAVMDWRYNDSLYPTPNRPTENTAFSNLYRQCMFIKDNFGGNDAL